MKLRFRESRQRSRLAAALAKHRVLLSQSLYAAVRAKSCATWQVPQEFEQVEDWGRAQLLTAIDLLTAWYRTGDVVYQELFSGWVHSRLVADLASEGAPVDYKSHEALALIKDPWSAVLETQLSSDAINVLRTDLDRVADSLSKPPLKRIRALFIGDWFNSKQ